MKVKLKRLKIENEKWKWKKNLENSRETRISLVSVSGTIVEHHSVADISQYLFKCLYSTWKHWLIMNALKHFCWWLCTMTRGGKIHKMIIIEHFIRWCNVYLNRTNIPGAYYPLVREEVLHGEPRLQVRVLLSLHSPHRAPHPCSRRQNLHQVSSMTFRASRLSM